MKCRKLLKRGFQTSPSRYCQGDKTHCIVALGPNGERIDHGEFCEKHAVAMLRRFAASDSPKVARCHPVIRADQCHADALGCEVGDLICGVRWFEPYRGQEVING